MKNRILSIALTLALLAVLTPLITAPVAVAETWEETIINPTYEQPCSDDDQMDIEWMYPLLGVNYSEPSIMPFSANAVTSGPWIWPVPQSRRISSSFRWPRTTHYGIDIPTQGATRDVVASKGGTVAAFSRCTHAGVRSSACGELNGTCRGGLGEHIFINHGDGFWTLYAHLQANSIPSTFATGRAVAAGATIGRTGRTGSSTGIHLHFEIRQGGQNGTRINSNPAPGIGVVSDNQATNPIANMTRTVDGMPPIPYVFDWTERNITIGSMSNGRVTANLTRARPGITVNLTVTPNSGFRLRANTLRFNTTAVTGTSFIMPAAAVTVTAEFEPIPPTITNITANPTAIISNGGNSTITATGTNLVPANMRIAAFLNNTGNPLYTRTPTGSATSVSTSLTFPANTGTTNRVYTIRISTNSGSTWLTTPTGTVTVNALLIADIVASPTVIDHIGGNSTITATGTNLVPSNMRIAAFLNNAGSALYVQTPSGNASSVSASLTFPANTGTTNRVYTIKASVDNGSIWWDFPTATITVTAEPDYGDVDGDGVITSADVTMLRRYIGAENKNVFRAENISFNLANADVNGDGVIDSEDVTLLRSWIAARDKDSVALGPQP
jgi:hypothetical protein